MASHKLAALFALLISHILAQNISLLAGSTLCDADCKQAALYAAAWERSQHASEPLDAFYKTPAEFGPNTKPGDVLRVELHTNLTTYTVPSGLTMSRILYASQDLNGTTVLASGFVLWPYEGFNYTGKESRSKDKPASTFPAVAWAHGTTGLHQRCAPSNYKALQYHFITTFILGYEGFAVIAPDYAGLGASARPNGDKHPHQWIAGPSNANDLAFAVEAARKAFPDRLAKDGPFVAMGHSQGGVTAWAFAERQAKTPVAGYRGTISISPAVDAFESIKQAIQAAVAGAPLPSALFQIAPLISQAITAVYPSFNYTGFSDRVFDRFTKVIAPLELCLPAASFLTMNLTLDDYIADPSWLNRSEALEWAERTSIGRKPFVGPLSVILGAQDATPPEALVAGIDDTCVVPKNKNEHLEYHQFGAMGHFGVISASRARWMQWIKDRMTDKPLARQCGEKTIIPGFDTNYTSFVGQFPPNWLVEAAPKGEEWKLTL